MVHIPAQKGPGWAAVSLSGAWPFSYLVFWNRKDISSCPGSPFCLVLKKRGFEGPKTAAQKPASFWMVFLIQFRNLVT